MATNYPGSLDSLPRPSSSTAMNASGYEGDVVIDNLSDAVEAVQAELGTDPAGAQATVKARLEAAQRSMAGAAVWASGYYMSNIYASAGSAQAPSLLADTQHYVPFWCPWDVTVDRIAVQVFTGQTSANARLGIYSPDGTTNGPGALLLDAGEISCTSSGVKELTISQALSGGVLYWLAVLNKTANVAMLTPNLNGGARGIGHHASTATSVAQTCLYETRTYTSGLLGTASAVGSLTAAHGYPMLFWLRRT